MDFKLKKSELNFRVYKVDAKPTTAGLDNDIAVITPVAIPSWIMSPDKPSGVPRSVGDVWIQYSVSGNAFNVLKNDVMLIATISAWQYSGEEWVNVVAASYQSGKWVDWVTWLYNVGDECLSLTGGWKISGTGTKNADSIIAGSTTGAAKAKHYAYTTNAINLDNVSTIIVHIVEAAIVNTSDANCSIEIVDSSGTVVITEVLIKNKEGAIVTDKEVPIDVSTYSGEHTVRVCATNSSGSGDARKVYTKFDKVWCMV